MGSPSGSRGRAWLRNAELGAQGLGTAAPPNQASAAHSPTSRPSPINARLAPQATINPVPGLALDSTPRAAERETQGSLSHSCAGQLRRADAGEARDCTSSMDPAGPAGPGLTLQREPSTSARNPENQSRMHQAQVLLPGPAPREPHEQVWCSELLAPRRSRLSPPFPHAQGPARPAPPPCVSWAA